MRDDVREALDRLERRIIKLEDSLAEACHCGHSAAQHRNLLLSADSALFDRRCYATGCSCRAYSPPIAELPEMGQPEFEQRMAR